MKICVPIRAKIQKEAKKRLLEASEKADLAELWLDEIKDLDLKNLIAKAPLRLVCVVKRPADKGRFRGSFAAQAELLIQAINFGVKYVDVPLNMPDKLIKKIVQEARKKKVRVIISHHDFKKTPDYPKMLKMAEKMRQKGADVVKLACMARGLQDTIDMISVGKYLQGQKIPHILIAMGQKGILSRILTPTLGGEMMFASLGGKSTAPGQLSIAELRKAWSFLGF